MTIIIFIIVAAVIFFTRKMWGGYIVMLFKKRSAQKDTDNARSLLIQSGSVFSPRGTIRTFVVAIDIQEMGDGTAKISLAKLKEKEV
jgi:hypothetical protein